jgi:hypothetical protein
MLHVPAGADVDALKSAAERAIGKFQQPIGISIRAHNLRQIAFPTSLEHWLKRFEVGDVMHDPTLIVARARKLLIAAKSCRAELGKAVNGLFFDPDRRTLFVLLRGGSDAGTTAALRARVAAILHETWDRPEARGEQGGPDQLHVDVQVVTDLPARKLVAVDAKSASLTRRIGRALRRLLAPGAVAIAVTAVAVPAAARTDAGRPGHGDAGVTGMNVRPAGEFGVLFGLAVFADGQRQAETDAFASSGLQRYFGELRLAQQTQRPRQRRQRDPEEIGQVGS